MTIHAPFQPTGVTQLIITGAASASVSIDAKAKSVRLVNAGSTNPCFVRIGTGAQTATSADIVVRADSEIIIQKGDGQNTVAAIQSVGATTLYIQAGEGGI